jgi:hypothetical protein
VQDLLKYVSGDFFTDRTYRHKRNVLIFAVLGLFAKVLNIDLSGLQFYGVTLSPENANLVPGFLGIALVYSLIILLTAIFMDMYRRKLETGALLSERAIPNKEVVSFLRDYLILHLRMSTEEARMHEERAREWVLNNFDPAFAKDGWRNIGSYFRGARLKLLEMRRSLLRSAVRRYSSAILASVGAEYAIALILAAYSLWYLYADTISVVRLFV